MRATTTLLPKRRFISKGWIISFSIFLFLGVLALGALWYWNTHKKGIIRDKLETAIREKSAGLYQIKYDSLQMDEIAGNLSFSNMNLSHDSARYSELILQGNEPSFLLDIHIPEINISGVKTPRALIDKEIVGRKLEIKNPVIHIMYTNAGDDPAGTGVRKAIYEQILGNLKLIQADTILVSGAQINSSNRKTKKEGMKLQDVFITLVDVKVDSAGSADSSRIFFAKEISLSAGKLSGSSADKLYFYSAGDLSANSVSRDITIKSFRVVPALNEEAFVKALPAQGDRFDLSVNNIQIQQISLSELLDGKIIADHVTLPSPDLKIYRDLIIPRDTKNRVGAYPHQLMQKIAVRFRVKKIVVTDGFLEYKERHPVSRLAGHIRYHTMNATISNFTNDKKTIASNNIMTVDMNTRFLNKAPLRVTGHFYLLDPNGRFDINGNFGALDGAHLNPVIERTGMTHIKTGKINSAEFSIRGNDHVADGTVTMLYEDLKANALEKDKGSALLDKKTMASFIANMIIKNDNPTRKQDVRVAQVHLERNPNVSFFNFAWKSIFQGVMKTVGLEK